MQGSKERTLFCNAPLSLCHRRKEDELIHEGQKQQPNIKGINKKCKIAE